MDKIMHKPCQLSIVNCQFLGYLYLIQNLADDLLRSEVACFSLIRETDTVAQHIVSHGTHILGHHIATTLEEGI